MGAWIETIDENSPIFLQDVAPHVGAWIETAQLGQMIQNSNVAPHVGAWIETFGSAANAGLAASHPMWVRGLKHILTINIMFTMCRTPCGCVD